MRGNRLAILKYHLKKVRGLLCTLIMHLLVTVFVKVRQVRSTRSNLPSAFDPSKGELSGAVGDRLQHCPIFRVKVYFTIVHVLGWRRS